MVGDRNCPTYWCDGGEAAAVPCPWVQPGAKHMCPPVHTYMAGCGDQHRENGTCTTTDSTRGLILFPSLADQGERLLVKNILMYTAWIPPVTGLRHSAYPGTVSWCSGLPCCWSGQANPWGLQPWFSCWYMDPLRHALMCTDAYTMDPSSYWP